MQVVQLVLIIVGVGKGGDKLIFMFTSLENRLFLKRFMSRLFEMKWSPLQKCKKKINDTVSY